MTTAVGGDDLFKQGQHVVYTLWSPDGDKRITGKITDTLFGGFYMVTGPEGISHLVNQDTDRMELVPDNTDTQWIPVITPKLSLDGQAPEQPPHKNPELVKTKDAVEFGMSSPDLAVEVAKTVDRLSDRVLGPGKEQYEKVTADGVSYQNFETLSIGDLIEYTLEEIDDEIVYMVMLNIRLRRLQAALKAKES